MQDSHTLVARRLSAHIYRSADVPLSADSRQYSARRLRNAGVAHARRLEAQAFFYEYGGLLFIVLFFVAILLPKLP